MCLFECDGPFAKVFLINCCVQLSFEVSNGETQRGKFPIDVLLISDEGFVIPVFFPFRPPLRCGKLWAAIKLQSSPVLAQNVCPACLSRQKRVHQTRE